jgi:hypothetical protein
MSTKWPPLKLAQLAVLGALLSMSRLLAPPLILVCLRFRDRIIGLEAKPRTELLYFFVSLLLVLVPSLIGSGLVALVRRRIGEGREKKEWTQQQTDLACGWLKSRILIRNFRTAILLMFGCFLVFALNWNLVLRYPEFRCALTLVGLLSLLTPPRESLQSIRQSLTPDQPAWEPPDWAKTHKRLQSEHWGASNSTASGVR